MQSKHVFTPATQVKRHVHIQHGFVDARVCIAAGENSDAQALPAGAVAVQHAPGRDLWVLDGTHALRLIEDISPHSRGAMRRVLIGFTLENRRVQGMPGARCTRGPVRNEVGSGAHEHTGEAEASGIPCVMALRLMPRSPRRRIRLVPVAGGLKALRARLGSQHLRRLDTSNGCQDHTVLPYAQTSVVLRTCNRLRGSTRPATSIARRRSHVHHIRSRVRDDARPPLLPERDDRN